MADYNATVEAVLDEIAKLLAAGTGTFEARARAVRELAEAYAWLSRPDQPHGS